jgi:hypothetical protein
MPHLRRRLLLAGTAIALTAVLSGTARAGTPAALVQPARWVALGDSYTAGVIAATGAGTGQDGCARTGGSYPELIRRALGARVELVNVSCHGAGPEHISRRSLVPAGPPLPPGGEAPAFPPVPPQVHAVSQGTDVVTVGVGAGTVGFAGLLRRCAELGTATGNRGAPCRDAFDAELPARLTALAEEYGAMLWKVRQHARYARLLTVGYPAVFPEDVAARCRYADPLHFGPVTFRDLAWLRDSVLRPLNATIERLSHDHGAGFVDLYPGSVDHSVCDADSWTDGFRSAGPGPGSWAHVQPNAAGQRYAARLLTARHRSR